MLIVYQILARGSSRWESTWSIKTDMGAKMGSHGFLLVPVAQTFEPKGKETRLTWEEFLRFLLNVPISSPSLVNEWPIIEQIHAIRVNATTNARESKCEHDTIIETVIYNEKLRISNSTIAAVLISSELKC